MLECLDENNNPALQSKDSLKLGKFGGSTGKEDCLVVCRIFGLTGCEWNKISGECFAYMKKLSIGNVYKTSYCYTFDNPDLGEGRNKKMSRQVE